MKRYSVVLALAGLCTLAAPAPARDWWFYRSAFHDLGPTYTFPLGYYAAEDFYYGYQGHEPVMPWWVHSPMDAQYRSWHAAMPVERAAEQPIPPAEELAEDTQASSPQGVEEPEESLPPPPLPDNGQSEEDNTAPQPEGEDPFR